MKNDQKSPLTQIFIRKPPKFTAQQGESSEIESENHGMSKCYIEKKNGRYAVIDAKYGDVQGEYADEALAAVDAMKMGYDLSCQAKDKTELLVSKRDGRWQ